jgi:hypothetical protein
LPTSKFMPVYCAPLCNWTRPYRGGLVPARQRHSRIALPGRLLIAGRPPGQPHRQEPGHRPSNRDRVRPRQPTNRLGQPPHQREHPATGQPCDREPPEPSHRNPPPSRSVQVITPVEADQSVKQPNPPPEPPRRRLPSGFPLIGANPSRRGEAPPPLAGPSSPDLREKPHPRVRASCRVHASRGPARGPKADADKAITDAVDRHVQTEQDDDQVDSGTAGAVVPLANGPLMARQHPLTEDQAGIEAKNMGPELGRQAGAGDENRTRTISLGS